MNKLISQLLRLYCIDGQQFSTVAPGDGELTESLDKALAGDERLTLNLVNASGLTRTLVISFENASDWAAVSAFHHALQEELDLPGQAVSVGGIQGFSVWVSLEQPIKLNEAIAFLAALRHKYLSEFPANRLRLLPGESEVQIEMVPAYYPKNDKWSAFIDPTLGSMFREESGLDMAPNLDRQADLLAGIQSIKLIEFQRVFAQLTASMAGEPPISGTEPSLNAQFPTAEVGPSQGRLNVGGGFTEPRSFLLAVMNDPTALATLRLEAAKALLPYCEKQRLFI